jgi:hypothetical protein
MIVSERCCHCEASVASRADRPWRTSGGLTFPGGLVKVKRRSERHRSPQPISRSPVILEEHVPCARSSCPPCCSRVDSLCRNRLAARSRHLGPHRRAPRGAATLPASRHSPPSPPRPPQAPGSVRDWNSRGHSMGTADLPRTRARPEGSRTRCVPTPSVAAWAWRDVPMNGHP